MTLAALHVKPEAPAFADQGAYQASVMRYLPEELITAIMQWAIPEKNSCTLALVCRHWKQIIYTIHPFHLLKQQRFTSSAAGFYLYSYVENKQQVAKINQALGGWLPAFIANCQNARQAAFTLTNMWLTPFSTKTSSSNPELAEVLEILRGLKISSYIPQQHLKTILQAHATISFSIRLLTTAIQLGYLSLQDIPQKLRCYAICLTAVRQNGRALEYVPKELQTLAICLAAVQRNGMALVYVPKELQTLDICLAAVQQDGRALQYVPEELKISELCLAAVQQNGRTLEYVPKELQTLDVCLIAVQQTGMALEYVPKELRTLDVCLIAVQQIGDVLQYVPKELQTLDVCLIAVQQNGWALECVPKELRTLDVCLAAVQQNGWVLQYVPEELRTPELCLAAVQQDGWAIQHVPKELQKLCLATVQNHESF